MHSRTEGFKVLFIFFLCRKIAEAHYVARQPQPNLYWKSVVFSVNRFYSRVATFIMEQPVADPLVDVLIYFLKEWVKLTMFPEMVDVC
jgi:hypothetical protein